MSRNRWKNKKQLRKDAKKAAKVEKNKRKFGRSKIMKTTGEHLYGTGQAHKEWKKPAVVEEEYWEIEIETVESCSKAPGEVVIWIRPLAKVKIDALMEKFPSIEWFAYMLGEVGEDHSFIVNDLYIPKQTVTSTSVDEIDAPDFNKLPVIGALHSHHGMGNGFSGTDHKYVNGNHNISLVISKDGVAGQVRWQTPCGALKIVEAKVKPLMEVDFDKDGFLETETKKIEKKSYTTPGHVGGSLYPGNVGGHNYNHATGGRVFPSLNQQENELLEELDQMDQENDVTTPPMTAVEKGAVRHEKANTPVETTGTSDERANEDQYKKNNQAYEKSVSDEWVNDDQSLVDALKEAFGDDKDDS